MKGAQYLKDALRNIIQELEYEWPKKAIIEEPKNPEHGDLATNIALVLPKKSGQTSHDLAVVISKMLQEKEPILDSVTVAGPGFINIVFSPSFWQKTIQRIEVAGHTYGSLPIGNGAKIHLEYVSANPTGPLHIGHGRGAAVGDTLARLLRFGGYNVTTEYYINDAGRQMRLLGLSIWLRVKELSGIEVVWPEEWYRGQYIVDIAHRVMNVHQNIAEYSNEDGVELCFSFGMNEILQTIKEDLQEFRVEHEVWFSEQKLVESGAVDSVFNYLESKGLTFEQDGALWFRSTAFGDDKDRVLRKSDGLLTYFASDIAYHYNKYNRGFSRCIDVLGADHHGYLPRVRAAVSAFGYPETAFNVVLIQLVNLLENGEQIAMSTRSGQFEKLIDVINEVGVDAARFMFLSRSSDSPLDFDLEVTKQRTMDNPVYYVQYAYARVSSIIRKALEQGVVLPDSTGAEEMSLLSASEEIALLRKLDFFEDVVSNAIEYLAPQYITQYLMSLAGDIHSYYGKYHILKAENDLLLIARLVFLRAVKQVIENALTLLGVSSPESM